MREVAMGLPKLYGDWIPATDAGLSTDTHALKARLVRRPGGAATFSQTHIFSDERTGSLDIPISHSGYVITQRVFAGPRSRKWKIEITKEGYAAMANGFSSSAGQGYITLTVAK
jgi:hypothetical protein